jgi:hypothetical protein
MINSARDRLVKEGGFNRDKECIRSLLRKLRHKVMRLQRMCPVTTSFSEAHEITEQLQGTDTKMYSFTSRLGDNSPVITGAAP